MTRIDARGMRCPWPAIRAAKALRESGSVEVLADDPAAARELAALAAAADAAFETCGKEAFRLVRRG